MALTNEPAMGNNAFESLKKLNEHSAEFWSARDLQPQLGYVQWRRFEDAIKRAMISCEQSGNRPDYHFANVGKMITVGKGGEREVDDYHLSRFACYLMPKMATRAKQKLPLHSNILPYKPANKSLPSNWPPTKNA